MDWCFSIDACEYRCYDDCHFIDQPCISLFHTHTRTHTHLDGIRGSLLTNAVLSSVGAGLLPASLVLLNLSVTLWNANTNNPDRGCNDYPQSVRGAPVYTFWPLSTTPTGS